MSLLLADSYNRTDSATTLGSTDGAGTADPAAWAAQTGINGTPVWGINGNQGYLAVVPDIECTAAVDCGAADIILDADVTLSTVAARSGITFRDADDDNYWLVHLMNSGGRNRADLYSKIGGSYALEDGPFLNGAVVLGHTYQVHVEADGPNIDVKIDGVSAFSFATSVALDGNTKVGLYENAYFFNIGDRGDDGGTRFDNLVVNGIRHGGWGRHRYGGPGF